MALDEMLVETTETYLSGSETSNLDGNAKPIEPYLGVETDYTLTSQQYTAYFFEQDDTRQVRVEFETENPDEVIDSIADTEDLTQENEWRYRSEDMMVGYSTEPGQIIVEMKESHENPGQLGEYNRTTKAF